MSSVVIGEKIHHLMMKDMSMFIAYGGQSFAIGRKIMEKRLRIGGFKSRVL